MLYAILVKFEVVAADILTLAVFSSDQINGAVDDAIVIQNVGPAVQATAKSGSSTANIYSGDGYSMLTGSLLNPFYCPPNQFLLIGNATANEAFSGSLRFLEYI